MGAQLSRGIGYMIGQTLRLSPFLLENFHNQYVSLAELGIMPPALVYKVGSRFDVSIKL